MFKHFDLVPEEKSCVVCGQPLIGDPEDQPFPPVGPMCGECYRAREFDESLLEQDLQGDNL